jgi:hypothetical protein
VETVKKTLRTHRNSRKTKKFNSQANEQDSLLSIALQSGCIAFSVSTSLCDLSALLRYRESFQCSFDKII